MTHNNSIAPHLQAFFADYLCRQKRLSPQTIVSCRDTFRLLLTFLREHTGNEASPQQAAGYQTEGHCRGDTTVSPPSSLCKVTSEQAPRNLLIDF